MGVAIAAWPWFAGCLFATVTLGPGSILVLRRRRVGPWLVSAGSAAALMMVPLSIVWLFGDQPCAANRVRSWCLTILPEGLRGTSSSTSWCGAL